MTKKKFIDLLMTKGEFSSKDEAKRKLGTMLETIENVLVKGDEIFFLGFGKFKVTERSVRTCKNLQTGEEMQVEAKKVVKFKPGKSLAEKVNK